MASQSARNLRDGLSSILGYRIKLVRPDGHFRPRPTDTTINWGNSQTPEAWRWSTKVDINHPAFVQAACNKLSSFQRFKAKEVSTPDWTIDQDEAQTWINDGYTIVVRHSLTGHSGQGIEVVSEGELPHAPLYTKYKKKRHEYRVHVWKGEVIDTQQKRKSREANNSGAVNTLIRNHSNGWVFCHNDVTPDIRRDTLAIQSVQALGLSFGGVDIIYNEHEDQYYTLEVNSAPGLEGSTVNKYVQAILS